MKPLVDAKWVAEHLSDPAIRILECSVDLAPGSTAPESMRKQWVDGHIPNSDYVDLIDDLSDPTSELRFTMPTPARFAAAMESLGVGEGTKVVLYDRRFTMWATRVWWMLKYCGFDNCAVLDGGWKSWQLANLPIDTNPAPSRPKATFVVNLRPYLFADLERMEEALGDGTCVINALSPGNHDGSEADYGRPGHLPGASNVYALHLLDRTTQCYLPLDQLEVLFADMTAGKDSIVTYCGGGIAATSDAFVLNALLGYNNVAVYDGSLSEWLLDADRPLEVDIT